MNDEQQENEMQDDVVFQLTVSPDTLQEAAVLATARGTSVNELIVIALEGHLIDAELDAVRARVGGLR